MAFLPRIKVFETEKQFCAIRRSLRVPSVAYCKETDETYFHHRRLGNVGDIVLYDKFLEEELVVYYTEYNATDFPLATFTPTGVIVIPQWYCGDNYARVMSLVNMSCSTPETGKASNNVTDLDGNGTYDIYLRWGGYETENWTYHDIPELVNFGEDGNRYQIYVDRDNEPTGESSNWGYLPSDSYHMSYKGSEEDISTDKGSHWYNGCSENMLPSPYTTRLERNPMYGRSADGGQNSPLSDFNGKQNTQYILSYETKQANWQTDDVIDNTYEGDNTGHFPAALCCARYHTDGTNPGDWYLPAMGELGCIMGRFAIIQAALKAVQTVSASLAVPLHEGYGYWSSSEYSSYNACYVNTNSGYMNNSSKSSDIYVRAFRLLRI